MRGQVERVFLYWARPLAPVLCMLVYGAVELVRPETPAEQILLPMGASVLAALAYLALVPRLGIRRVLQGMVVVDTLLIAWMTLALAEPEVLAIAYFWSIALAAFFLSHRETLLATAVAAACAAVVPFLSSGEARLVVVVTDVLVLALIGALLALFADQARRADQALVEASRLDATVLSIAEQVRSSLEVDAVLQLAASEIGRATGSARGLIRLLRERAELFQWLRDGVEPVAVQGLPATVAVVASTGKRYIVEAYAETLPEEIKQYMRDVHIQAFIAIPVVLHGEVVAVIGLHDDKPRRWGTAVELVQRVAPQVGAALAQAEAFEYERRVAALRERLIANVSHELRTPLTSTIGFLQTLARPDLDFAPEQRAEFLRVALEQAQRLARLVEDLLTLSSLEGAPAPQAEPVHVRHAIDRAVRELELGGRQLELAVPDDLVVQAEADRLVQVFSNLIRNALVHGRGTISVRGERRDGSASVVVADEGDGIPGERREEVFIPFARWNAQGNGTGLGLPISRSIVESFGGTLVYDGAFVVTLPA